MEHKCIPPCRARRNSRRKPNFPCRLRQFRRFVRPSHCRRRLRNHLWFHCRNWPDHCTLRFRIRGNSIDNRDCRNRGPIPRRFVRRDPHHRKLRRRFLPSHRNPRELRIALRRMICNRWSSRLFLVQILEIRMWRRPNSIRHMFRMCPRRHRRTTQKGLSECHRNTRTTWDMQQATEQQQAFGIS